MEDRVTYRQGFIDPPPFGIVCMHHALVCAGGVGGCGGVDVIFNVNNAKVGRGEGEGGLDHTLRNLRTIVAISF
jgi:hypothetical protein